MSGSLSLGWRFERDRLLLHLTTCPKHQRAQERPATQYRDQQLKRLWITLDILEWIRCVYFRSWTITAAFFLSNLLQVWKNERNILWSLAGMIQISDVNLLWIAEEALCAALPEVLGSIFCVVTDIICWHGVLNLDTLFCLVHSWQKQKCLETFTRCTFFWPDCMHICNCNWKFLIYLCTLHHTHTCAFVYLQTFCRVGLNTTMPREMFFTTTIHREWAAGSILVRRSCSYTLAIQLDACTHIVKLMQCSHSGSTRCMYAHTDVCTSTCKRTCTCIHTYIHIYIRIHTQWMNTTAPCFSSSRRFWSTTELRTKSTIRLLSFRYVCVMGYMCMCVSFYRHLLLHVSV